MNKTLMLVICDFLLLSMLALARFDPPEELPKETLNTVESSITAEAELVRLLEETLEAEQESRSGLNKDLNNTRDILEEKARELAEREATLAETQKILEEKAAEATRLAEDKRAIETAQQKLAAEKARLEAERQEMAKKFESARTKLEAANSEQIELVQTLGQLKEKSSLSEERLSQTEQDLITREVALAQREAELKAAQEEAKKLNVEREKLQQQLQVAHAERTFLEQTLSREQQEKQQLQSEKAQVLEHATRLTQNVTELGAGVSQLGTGVSQLGQGVSKLVQNSEDIKKEIDASRPRTVNEIFTRFQNNRATIRFISTEEPRLGIPKIHYYESKSILISENTNTYLVTHITNTPFAFNKNPEHLLNVRLRISLSDRTYPITQIAFLKADPRILCISLPEDIVKAANLETFELASQPDRWEEAILIKNDESNFGSAEFRRLPQSERFFKMSRPVLGELFNDFASSRGDLAFSKNDQFIGLLADEKHAVVIDNFRTSALLNLGSNFDTTKYTAISEHLKNQLQTLPEEVR